MKKRFRIGRVTGPYRQGSLGLTWQLGSLLFTCAITGFSWRNQLQLLVNITTLTTLNMEETQSPETSETVYQTARRLIPQDRRFDRDRFEVTWQKQSWFVKFSILCIHVHMNHFNTPTKFTSYISKYICYQISPTCFGVLYTILREKLVYCQFFIRLLRKMCYKAQNVPIRRLTMFLRWLKTMYNSLFCFLGPYKYLKSLFAAREDMLAVKGYCSFIMYGVSGFVLFLCLGRWNNIITL